MGKAVDTLQPGQERPYQVRGNYLTVLKSLQLLEIELVNKSDAYESHFLKQGASIFDKQFSSIVVRNDGDAPADIIIITGTGKFQPSQSDSIVKVDTSDAPVNTRLDADQLNLQVNQQTTGANNNGLAKVELLAGQTGRLCQINEFRKYVKYNMLSSSDCEYVTIGGSVVDANTGFALERGMVSADETTGELWAHNPSGVTTTVYVMEVSD